MTLLTVDGVSKTFGDVRAVDGVSFSIDRGEVVGFLGPNGAGKSTTMRMITQFLDPDEGGIAVDGYAFPDGAIEAKRRIGYLPENNPLYPDMLVVDYLEYIARLRGITGPAARQAIDDAVGATGIQAVYYRPIEELSKGYRQRVGLAQAILHRPDLLVLDEPTEGLDPSQRVEIRRLIADLGRDRTVMLSTHVLSEVQTTASRLLIIARGQLVADGPASQLVAQASGVTQVFVELDGGDGALDALGALEGASAVASSPAGDGRTAATITVEPGVDLRPAVFQTAVKRGWTLYELRRETQSLEELFLSLTADDGSDQAGGEA